MQRNPFTIAQVREHWDRVAAKYDEINRHVGWTHTERFTTMQTLLPAIEDPAVLNVWSRTGNAIPFIRTQCPTASIENLEASAAMISIARERYPQESFAQTDLHNLPCSDASKDVVVSLETLEHVPDPLHFLLECHRVLKVGGHLILSCPPAWAELPLRLYERYFENHGEGPHRFLSVTDVLTTLRYCDFEILEHRGTVLLPVGPEWLKRTAETLQRRALRHIGGNALGIRHFFVARKTRHRDPVWAKIHEEILRPGLDMQTGTCIGLSGGTLMLHDPDGACTPKPTGTGPVPSICYHASPEVEPEYPSMQEAVYGKHNPRSTLLGEYRRIAIAHHADEAVRRNSASGGVLSGVLLHLLETGKIRGAVVLTMDTHYPWRAVPIIARSREEILAAAQSKYVVSPVNTILEALKNEEGPLAYVGLPHQVFAVRRLQHLQHPSVRAIRYVLGPFFGNELSGASVDAFLRKFNAHKSDVVDLQYRAGEWPGYLQAILRDGRTVRLPKFHANYLIPFYITEHSLQSHDLTNEFTDLSGGDAWAPAYEERGKGYSLLITRTQTGDMLISEMEQQGKLVLQDIGEEEAIRMQSHGLDLKKRGAFLRMERRRRKGLRVHEFGLLMPAVPRQRRIFEVILGAAFAFCRSPIGRFCANVTPHWVIGPLFQWFRNVWKAGTGNVKRHGLSRSDATVA
jgi:coenzyme F420 hydrogenase subunit beta